MIIHEETDGRMLQIIEGHYAAGHEFIYIPQVHTLVIKWQVPPNARGHGGYQEKILCQLGKWFTDAAQDYVIDLIFPYIHGKR